MQKQSLKSLAKIVTLGLVLGTTLTATSSVWADEPPIKKGTGEKSIIMNNTGGAEWDNHATGKYSTAFGDCTYAGAVNNGQTIHAGSRSYTADKDYTGQSATAWGSQTLAIGNWSTAFGGETQAKGDWSTAWGQFSIAQGARSTAFGHGSKAGGDNSLAALGGETGDWSEATPTGGYSAVAIGVGAKAKENYSVAIGRFAQTGLGTKTTAKGNEVINEFAVGGGTDGDGKINYSQITGVADGVNDHDAVNLKQVNELLGTTGTGEAFTKLKDDVAGIHDDINGLNSQIDRMGTRIDKVGAGAAALAAMHPVYDEDSKLTFSAGLGAYRGEQAAAVGMFYRFTDRVMMNAGATVGNNDNMYNVGLNFALDRSVGSKLPSKAVMAKEINSLKTENQEMKQEIAELKAMVQALIANK